MKDVITIEEGLAIDRLEIFIKNKRQSRREFEQNIGIANGYIGKQLKSKGAIGSHILRKILIRHPELNIIWLITGQQKMITGNKLKIKQRRSTSTKLKASA